MRKEDIHMLDQLIKDKGKKYKIKIDTYDGVLVFDKTQNNKFVHSFEEKEDFLLEQILQYLGMDAQITP